MVIWLVLRDVARKANVSPTTVSRVLNEDKTINVADQTKGPDFAVAASLNYDINKRKYVKKRCLQLESFQRLVKPVKNKIVTIKELRAGLEEKKPAVCISHESVYNLSDNPTEWKDLDQLGAIIVVGTVNRNNPSLIS